MEEKSLDFVLTPEFVKSKKREVAMDPNTAESHGVRNIAGKLDKKKKKAGYSPKRGKRGEPDKANHEHKKSQETVKKTQKHSGKPKNKKNNNTGKSPENTLL